MSLALDEASEEQQRPSNDEDGEESNRDGVPPHPGNGAILSAAGLSFIGFGTQPPTAEWGVMISEGRNYIATQPWLSLFPGLAILFTVAAFNLIVGSFFIGFLRPQSTLLITIPLIWAGWCAGSSIGSS